MAFRKVDRTFLVTLYMKPDIMLNLLFLIIHNRTFLNSGKSGSIYDHLKFAVFVFGQAHRNLSDLSK